MPKVTVYVRKDDYESWKAIEEKTEFIHRALNPSFLVLNKSISEATKLVKTTDYNSPASKSKLCKHGSVKGGCFSKEAPRMKCNV